MLSFNTTIETTSLSMILLCVCEIPGTNKILSIVLRIVINIQRILQTITVIICV